MRGVRKTWWPPFSTWQRWMIGSSNYNVQSVYNIHRTFHFKGAVGHVRVHQVRLMLNRQLLEGVSVEGRKGEGRKTKKENPGELCTCFTACCVIPSPSGLFPLHVCPPLCVSQYEKDLQTWGKGEQNSRRGMRDVGEEMLWPSFALSLFRSKWHTRCFRPSRLGKRRKLLLSSRTCRNILSLELTLLPWCGLSEPMRWARDNVLLVAAHTKERKKFKVAYS